MSQEPGKSGFGKGEDERWNGMRISKIPNMQITLMK